MGLLASSSAESLAAQTTRPPTIRLTTHMNQWAVLLGNEHILVSLGKLKQPEKETVGATAAWERPPAIFVASSPFYKKTSKQSRLSFWPSMLTSTRPARRLFLKTRSSGNVYCIQMSSLSLFGDMLASFFLAIFLPIKRVRQKSKWCLRVCLLLFFFKKNQRALLSCSGRNNVG